MKENRINEVLTKNDILIEDKPIGYDIFLTTVISFLTLIILTRPDHELKFPAFFFFTFLTFYSLNRTFSLLRVNISVEQKIIFRSNFSFVERIRDKFLQHPTEIHFDDVEDVYVDDNGSSKADLRKYHVFIKTNDPYYLPIATFSRRIEAEKLLLDIIAATNLRSHRT